MISFATKGFTGGRSVLIGLQLFPPSALLNIPPRPVTAYIVSEFLGSIARDWIDPPCGPRLVHSLIPAQREAERAPKIAGDIVSIRMWPVPIHPPTPRK